MSYAVAVDIGGTFTDLVAFDPESKKVIYAKSPTTYGNFVEGIFKCFEHAGVGPGEAGLLNHGTTLVINSLIQRQGAKTALVTTQGFRDVLEIARANRPDPFDLYYRRDEPLVPRDLRFEVAERIGATGEIITPLDTEALEELAMRIKGLDIEAVAVFFMNSYLDPSHEERAAEILKAKLPGVYVTYSTELTREWYEYERSSTAVANAYVGPQVSTYVRRLESDMENRGFDGSLFMMGSNGGLISVDRTCRQPVSLVESGPIGGCIGAGAYAGAFGIKNLISFDMGGTTAKCALIDQGRFSVESGDQPTVTDANLVLGRLNADRFLGGELKLDTPGAGTVIADKIADPLGYPGADGMIRMADGIISIATVTMAGAIRRVSVEHGLDPRDFALFSYGGGGPLHAAALARELSIPLVIVPPEPGNFSAIGMLLADARIDASETFTRALEEDAVGDMRAHFLAMEDAAAAALARDFGAQDTYFEHQAEMRFCGQRHNIKVPVSGLGDVAAIRAAFAKDYKRRYGHADAKAEVEFQALHLSAFAALSRPDIARLPRRGGEAVAESVRPVYFGSTGTMVETKIFDRGALAPGFAAPGPAVIEEYGSTTLVAPGDRFEIGDLHEIRIHCGEG
jgi:N-methylhydantoinase A